MIEPINYLLVFSFSLIGYLLGVGLGYIAPEELKPGEKYLKFLEKAFFVLTFLPMVYFFKDSFWMALPISIMGILLYISFEYRTYILFAVFLLWFFVIRSDNLVIFLEAAAIFLYGLPAGSLLLLELSPATVTKLKKKVKIW